MPRACTEQVRPRFSPTTHGLRHIEGCARTAANLRLIRVSIGPTISQSATTAQVESMPALPEESMLVEQVMHDNPETLTPEHRLKDALPVYERHGVNCVPILDTDKRVRGILTIFRLVQAIRQGKSFDTPIAEVMDVDLVSIRNDATFGAACSLPIDRMLVLDHEDKLVGVLTKKELIHKIYNAFCNVDCHNRELDAVINCATDGIIIFDQEGVPLYTNDKIRSLLPDCDNMQNPASPAMTAVAELLKKTIASRKAGSALLEECNGKQVVFTITPIFDADQRLFRCVLSAQDMTEITRLQEEAENSRRKLAAFQEASLKGTKVIAHNPDMQRLLNEAARLGEVDSTVLITGETGAGKEVVAMSIHNHSKRRHGPLVQINCGTIPQHLQEAELFGYEKGSFTGANACRVGMLEVAHEGTLMLDEVGEMDLPLQVKLLRALQEGVIYRIGGRKPVRLDVRIIAMTNRDLAKMVRENTFREDLYYRLNVIPLSVPPLRQRNEDIVPLAQHFLSCFGKKYSCHLNMTSEEKEMLLGYSWPGNVRELANFMERLTIASLSSGNPALVWKSIARQGDQPDPSKVSSMREQMRHFERQCLENALRNAPSIRAASRELGVSHATLLRKMREHNIVVQK